MGGRPTKSFMRDVKILLWKPWIKSSIRDLKQPFYRRGFKDIFKPVEEQFSLMRPHGDTIK